jgi:hypothetical protein
VALNEPNHDETRSRPRDVVPPNAQTSASASHAVSHDHQHRHSVLHIRIIDVATGQLKVGLSVPAGLMRVALRQGARLLPPGVDTVGLLAAAEHGQHHAPVIADDVAHGERFEISIDG